jgi:pyruvate/2-oxoacid:ferredoxin oxidoreductase beta subunit
MKYLKGFNFVEFLKCKFMIGKLDPWRIDDDGKPFFALLVSLEHALQECNGWSNQEFTRTELKNYLALNNIWCLKNIEELQQIREERKEERKNRKKATRDYTEEQRKELSERMKKLNASRKASIIQNPQ